MLSATMAGLKKFISHVPFEARYLECNELVRRKLSRVGAAKELENGDIEICLHGSNRLGAYYGFVLWTDIIRKPRIAAWLQRGDFVTVASLVTQIRRRKTW